MLARDFDDSAARHKSNHTFVRVERMARQMRNLGPRAVGPYRQRVAPHVPDRRSVVQALTAQIPRRLISAKLPDISDIDQSGAVVAQQDGRDTAHTVVAREGPRGVEPVAPEALIARQHL